MTPGRGLAYGFGCLATGWAAAGWLEHNRAPVWLAALVFLGLVLAVATVADRLVRGRWW